MYSKYGLKGVQWSGGELNRIKSSYKALSTSNLSAPHPEGGTWEGGVPRDGESCSSRRRQVQHLAGRGTVCRGRDLGQNPLEEREWGTVTHTSLSFHMALLMVSPCAKPGSRAVVMLSRESPPSRTQNLEDGHRWTGQGRDNGRQDIEQYQGWRPWLLSNGGSGWPSRLFSHSALPTACALPCGAPSALFAPTPLFCVSEFCFTQPLCQVSLETHLSPERADPLSSVLYLSNHAF